MFVKTLLLSAISFQKIEVGKQSISIVSNLIIMQAVKCLGSHTNAVTNRSH